MPHRFKKTRNVNNEEFIVEIFETKIKCYNKINILINIFKDGK